MASNPHKHAPTSFGTLLQQYRLQAGLTQERLAERAGLSVRGLSDLERGVNAIPRRDTLSLLLTALTLTDEQQRSLVRAAQRQPRKSADYGAATTLGSSSLPYAGDPLIGREGDLEAVCAHLRDPSVNLVTLIGPGGVGKTRLGIASARVMAAESHAVVWTSLAAARSTTAALSSIAATLGFEARSTAHLTEQLARALQFQSLILALDNLEHLPDLSPDLGRLLAAIPSLTILATSRAPLRLRGEHRFHVQPLAIGRSRGTTPESPAAELFVRRATEVDLTFSLSDQNRAAVELICRRLEGLPLAIELAAARTAVLPPADLLERLERALPLLTSAPRDAPDRQRTLRDAIAWSYDLLVPETQWAFRRLSVCLDGFTLETADHLLSGALSGTGLDAVTSLVEQSLLRVMPDTLPPRYAMLETVREFALEQLQISGETDAAYLQHARWFAAQVVVLNARLNSPDELVALRGLDAELHNIRQAMSTFLGEAAMIVEASELAASLDYFCRIRGLYRESLNWYTGILEHRDSLPTQHAAELLLSVSSALNVTGDPLAEDLARESLGLLAEVAGVSHTHHDELADAYLVLADCMEDPNSRRQFLDDGLIHARLGVRETTEAFLLAMHGLASAELGDYELALVSGKRALEIQHRAGGPTGIGHASGMLGHVLRMQGQYTDAAEQLLTAFRCFWSAGALDWTAGSAEGLADCAAHIGLHERAAWLYGAASQLRLRSSWSTDMALFGRTPESWQLLIDALGEQAFADLQAAGEAATWQDLHDVVIGNARNGGP